LANAPMSDLDPVRRELEARAKARAKSESNWRMAVIVGGGTLVLVLGGLLWGHHAFERSVIRSNLLAPVSSGNEVLSACIKWTGSGLYALTDTDLHVVCRVAKAAMAELSGAATTRWCGEAVANIQAEWKRHGGVGC
jgi:hypothetical protein